MAVSVETSGLFEKVFGNFKKITPALIALALATGLILFLPEGILAKMSLTNLQDIWKRIVGIVFIVSLALILTIIIVETLRLVNRRIAPKIPRKQMRSQFIKLPLNYKRMLIEVLQSKRCAIELDPTSGNTLYLLSNHFIHQAQPYIFAGVGYTAPSTYTPEPWLIDLYNKEPDLFKL